MSEEKEVPNPSLVGIVIHPSQQFDRISNKPIVWRALVIEMVLVAITLSLGKTYENSIVNTLGFTAIIVIAVIGPLIRVGILSALFMIFTRKLTVTFKHLASLNTYISFILVINIIVRTIAILIAGENPEVLFTNMNVIINLTFAIWMTILTAFGLMKVAGYSKTPAWIVSILFILLGALL